MIRKANIEIALTHIYTRKKQTLTAALGATIGVGVYLFMNSLSAGFSKFSRDEIFKNSAHIKVYKNDEISKPLISKENNTTEYIIVNPQITTLSKKIIDPEKLLETIKSKPFVTNALAHVNVDLFYIRGNAQMKGSGNGVDIIDYNAMFNTGKYMVAGSINNLSGNLNGIIIGSGIAEKLNLGVNDNITVSSSFGIIKVMKIVGIFTTGNSFNDQTKSYINIRTAQQLIKEGPSYVSTIFVNTPSADNSDFYVKELQNITEYTVEDWKTTSADVLSGDKTRSTLMNSISMSILLMTAFIIYNILSSTIMQKINDIAILKATGFSGSDVILIFLMEAIIMGFIGTILGLCFGSVLIWMISGVYMGGPVGYFPITFELSLYIQSFLLGLALTICAGYFPARNAARVDPVEIFRK